MSGRPLASYLTYAVASPGQKRAAIGATIGLLAVAIGSIPLRTVQLGRPDALLPAVVSATLVAMLVSSAMLRSQYHTTRYVPLAILSNAYSITAVLLLPYVLTFPHVFSPTGFGLGVQTSTWLWVIWHATFVLLLAGYVWADSFFSRKAIDAVAGAELARKYTVWTVTIAVSATLIVIYNHATLPVLVSNGEYTPMYHLLVDQLLLASACCVITTLVARTALRSTTHLWLAVILAAFALEIFLNGQVVNARFSVAWYMGFLEAGVWQTIFLFVQLHDSNQQLAAIAADTITLHEEAQRDSLTGVFNRRGYDARFDLAARESQAIGGSIALLVIDVDYFKKFNDHFGHLAGDDALRNVASAMSEVVNRPFDAVCRMGGDEFSILLAATDEHGAGIVAERIRSNITRLRIRNAPDVPIATMSVSIGFATANSGEKTTATELYERADKALYRAKHFGRNRIVGGPDVRGEGSLRAV